MCLVQSSQSQGGGLGLRGPGTMAEAVGTWELEVDGVEGPGTGVEALWSPLLALGTSPLPAFVSLICKGADDCQD